jgi:hypothetical protein
MMDDLRVYCVLRGAWQSRVYRVTHPDAVGAPLQQSRSSFHHKQQSLMRQQRLQMHPVSNEPVMFAGMGWAWPRGRIHPTPECIDEVVQLGPAIIIIIMLPNQAIASTPSAPRPSGAEGRSLDQPRLGWD